MQNQRQDIADVKGWGVDADPQNDPTYPLKKRTDAEQEGYTWERPTQQETDIEVLHSIERPNLTAVYGTSVPPSGLSGAIRRFAFNYSETTYRHWVSLMVADRVNMIEGLVDDVSRGRIPNFIEEWGWRAEWQYNRKALVTKCAIGAVIATAAAVWISSSGKRRR